jgi:hypothetical protein
LGIPESDAQAWISEQKKKGNIVVPMGDEVATIQRTITEQMNYKDCLLRQIDQTRWSLLYGEEPFARNVMMLVIMIPTQDQDEQFKEDLENAKMKMILKTDRRTYFPGKSSTVKKEAWVPDYFKIFEACINLFRRRGMLWSESKVEVMK